MDVEQLQVGTVYDIRWGQFVVRSAYLGLSRPGARRVRFASWLGIDGDVTLVEPGNVIGPSDFDATPFEPGQLLPQPPQEATVPTTHTNESLGLRDDVDLDHLRAAASRVVARIEDSRDDVSVQVSLAPGDGTVYHLMITPSGAPHVGDDLRFAHRSEWVVTLLNLNGRSYPWVPGHGFVHPSYAESRWADSPYTAAIVAAFLTLLAEEINRG